ncbi:hypothetical protein GGQ20_001460 [Salinibacter ruber]|nr:hypothetical protein [Salinibacter ruber]
MPSRKPIAGALRFSPDACSAAETMISGDQGKERRELTAHENGLT